MAERRGKVQRKRNTTEKSTTRARRRQVSETQALTKRVAPQKKVPYTRKHKKPTEVGEKINCIREAPKPYHGETGGGQRSWKRYNKRNLETKVAKDPRTGGDHETAGKSQDRGNLSVGV